MGRSILAAIISSGDGDDEYNRVDDARASQEWELEDQKVATKTKYNADQLIMPPEESFKKKKYKAVPVVKNEESKQTIKMQIRNKLMSLTSHQNKIDPSDPAYKQI